MFPIKQSLKNNYSIVKKTSNVMSEHLSINA